MTFSIEDALEAAIQSPECRSDIQPYLDGYQQLDALTLAKAAHRGEVNKDWRGVEL